MTFPFDFLSALWLTVRLAFASTLLLLIVGVPVAQWLARGKGAIPAAVEAILTLPIVLPPTVIGFYLFVTMGSSLALTFPALLAGSVIYSLPFAIRPFRVGLSKVPRELLEVARVSGVPAFETFWRVTLPLAGSGIVAGILLSFAHTLGIYGVLLMVSLVQDSGPSGPPGFAAVHIYYAVLLAAAFTLIFAVTLLRRRDAE